MQGALAPLKRHRHVAAIFSATAARQPAQVRAGFFATALPPVGTGECEIRSADLRYQLQLFLGVFF